MVQEHLAAPGGMSRELMPLLDARGIGH